MKKIAAIVAFGLALTGVAFADTIENGFNNTFVITGADGSVSRFYFNADNTFTATTADGTGLAGRWEIVDAQICLLAPSGQRTCTDIEPGKNVGDAWTQASSDGTQMTVSLEAGR